MEDLFSLPFRAKCRLVFKIHNHTFDTSSRHIHDGFCKYMLCSKWRIEILWASIWSKNVNILLKKLCQNFSWYIFFIVENQVIFLPCDTIPMFILFVCLDFSAQSRIFHYDGGVTITCEGLQILTYTRHWSSVSSEGSFACQHLLWHGASVYNGHLRGPVTLTLIAER